MTINSVATTVSTTQLITNIIVSTHDVTAAAVITDKIDNAKGSLWSAQVQPLIPDTSTAKVWVAQTGQHLLSSPLTHNTDTSSTLSPLSIIHNTITTTSIITSVNENLTRMSHTESPSQFSAEYITQTLTPPPRYNHQYNPILGNINPSYNQSSIFFPTYTTQFE